GPVTVGHDVTGGAGERSGVISTLGKLTGVTIDGSLIGGSNNFSGVIFSDGDMGTVTVGRDLKGGSISGNAPSLDGSGLIESQHPITRGRIRGSRRSGIAHTHAPR